MYQKTAGQAPHTGSGAGESRAKPGGGKEEEVIDAEYVDADDKK